MNAGTFHKFHDTGNEYSLAITDGVHLHLFAADILVNENWLILINLNSSFQILPQRRFFGNDLHGTPTQHEAGTDQDRIADFRSGCYAIFNIRNGLPFGLGNPQFQQQLFKGIAVFRLFDGGAVRADDLHAPLHQRLGQIDGPSDRPVWR